jgi:ABC-type multidrug transport system fused ATPase/permease subunit
MAKPKDVIKSFIKNAPFWSAFVSIASIGSALLVYLAAAVREKTIDALAGLETPNGARYYSLAFYLALFLLVTYISRYGAGAAKNACKIRLGKIQSAYFDERIALKKSRIAYSHLENPEMVDLFESLNGFGEKITDLILSGLNIATGIISIASILFYLSRLGAVALVILIVLYILVFAYSIKAGALYYDTWFRLAGFRRRGEYLLGVLMGRQYAPERIFFGSAPFFEQEWEDSFKKVRETAIKEEFKGASRTQVSSMLICIYATILLAAMCYKLTLGNIEIAFFVSAISLIPTLCTGAIHTISNEMNNFAKQLKALRNYCRFANIAEDIDVFSEPNYEKSTFKTISFVNVCFSYPCTGKQILKDLNMTIQYGKHYAIVGENGCGKSTIVKLLLRLYNVDEGSILIDGVNINDYRQSEIYGLMAALFQDYAKYYVTIGENIGIGNIAQIQNKPRIASCAAIAGISQKIESLPQKYDTMLGQMNVGGIELSGGEWQKICIARLLNSPCRLKILDEPTAALDPLREWELYHDYARMMEGATTVFITHRLASTQLADYIYVIGNKHVAESGTHEELMRLRGNYCNMYTAQQSHFI